MSKLPSDSRQRAELVSKTLGHLASGRMDSEGAKAVVATLILATNDWIRRGQYSMSVDTLRELVADVYLTNKLEKR
jgi:hypothetical protein